MNEKTPFDYFQQALTQFRLGTDNFVKAYPHAATHLNLGAQVMEDPHVSRLIEALAFMQSQTQAQLEDNFSKVNQGLLHILFPEHTAPLAAMSVIALVPAKNLTQTVIIPKGCLLESAPIATEPCYFQLGYETELIPAYVKAIAVQHKPRSVLKIKISSIDGVINFATLKPRVCRFYIDADPSLTTLLLDKLFQSTNTLELHSNTQRHLLNRNALHPVGFADTQQLLPTLSMHRQPYANLIEYVHYREKFFFFDIYIPEAVWKDCDHEIDLMIYFPSSLPAPLQELTEKNLKLNCAPIINLFEKYLEPLEIDHKQERYPILIDKRHPEHYQLHYLNTVTHAANNTVVPNTFSIEYTTEDTLSWHMQRSGQAIKEGFDINACALEINDCKEMLDLTPIALELKGLCSNGMLPHQLIWPTTEHHLQAVNAALPVDNMYCLLQPSAYSTQHLTHNKLTMTLQLIQQQQLGLLNPQQAKESLVNLLLLYATDANAFASKLADAVLEVQITPSKRYLADIIGNPLQFGFAVKIKLATNKLSSCSIGLFSHILEDCYAYHTPLNQFVTIEISYA